MKFVCQTSNSTRKDLLVIWNIIISVLTLVVDLILSRSYRSKAVPVWGHCGRPQIEKQNKNLNENRKTKPQWRSHNRPQYTSHLRKNLGRDLLWYNGTNMVLSWAVPIEWFGLRSRHSDLLSCSRTYIVLLFFLPIGPSQSKSVVIPHNLPQVSVEK